VGELKHFPIVVTWVPAADCHLDYRRCWCRYLKRPRLRQHSEASIRHGALRSGATENAARAGETRFRALRHRSCSPAAKFGRIARNSRWCARTCGAAKLLRRQHSCEVRRSTCRFCRLPHSVPTMPPCRVSAICRSRTAAPCYSLVVRTRSRARVLNTSGTKPGLQGMDGDKASVFGCRPTATCP